MKAFFKENGYLLLAILVVAIIGGIIANMMTKQVQVDAITGDAVPGGLVTRGKLNLKGAKPSLPVTVK